MTDSSSDFGSGASRAAEHPHTLEVIESDGEYTFVPRDADAGERLTRWITVGSDDVVDLDVWR